MIIRAFTAAVALLLGTTPLLAAEPGEVFDLVTIAPADQGKLVDLGGYLLHYDPSGWYNMILLNRDDLQPAPAGEEGFDYNFQVDGQLTKVVIGHTPHSNWQRFSAEQFDALVVSMAVPGSAAEPKDLVVTARSVRQLGDRTPGKRPVSMVAWEGTYSQDGHTVYVVEAAVPTRKGVLGVSCGSSRSVATCMSTITNGLRIARGAF